MTKNTRRIAALEQQIKNRNETIDRVAKERDQATLSLEFAERALDDAGFTGRYEGERLHNGTTLEVISWIAPTLPDTSKLVDPSTIEDAVREASAHTRRETLQLVIDALELEEYRDRSALGALLALNNPFGTGTLRDPKSGEPLSPTDRFAADLQTALDVRAEKKAAEARAATEEKVARLRRDVDLANVASAQSAAGIVPRVSEESYGAAQTFDKPKKAAPKKRGKKGGDL